MRTFDELNDLSEDEMLDIDEYFDEMELSEKEKEKRKEFAKDFFEIALFIFTLFSIIQEYNYVKVDFVTAQLQARYLKLAKNHKIVIDDYVKRYIENFSDEIVNITLKHIDEPFYLSEYRGLLISVNEANTMLNYKDFSDAVMEGNTRKRWITEKDNKVRKTHKVLDDKTIPIDDVFLVGDTIMRFPHDTLYGIDYKELSNCRCVVKYL